MGLPGTKESVAVSQRENILSEKVGLDGGWERGEDAAGFSFPRKRGGGQWLGFWFLSRKR